MAKAVLGPVLADVLSVSRGRHFTLASAFYSAARLDATTITADAADVLVRLDLASIDDWVAGAIAPDALLRFWKRHEAIGMKVYCRPNAHVKVYFGDRSFLVGSANFTVRGLAGSADEILWSENAPDAVRKMRRALNEYRDGMKRITISELEHFVARNAKRVAKLRARKPPRSPEATLPREFHRPPRVGSYDAFVTWLSRTPGDAADVIFRRANGAGQLSGHVRMNFYGIRQFLLSHPAESEELRQERPDNYRLVAHPPMERAINRFVRTEATDEGGLVVDTWRTYLPERSGGKPKSGGGTSGNLNRMLPLVARYLAARQAR